MKLIKGSAAAKSFMKKLRASKGKPKKLSGAKPKTKLTNNYVNILGQRVKKGTKLYNKLTSQKKHFDDLQKHEINGDTHTDTKSHNYKITIGNLKTDTLEQINVLNRKIENCEAFINHTQKMIFGKDAILKNPADRKIGKKNIAGSRKYISLYKKQIRELKKHI